MLLQVTVSRMLHLGISITIVMAAVNVDMETSDSDLAPVRISKKKERESNW